MGDFDVSGLAHVSVISWQISLAMERTDQYNGHSWDPSALHCIASQPPGNQSRIVSVVERSIQNWETNGHDFLKLNTELTAVIDSLLSID